MSTKVCSKCGEAKARSEFHADKSKPDGLRAHCRTCQKAADKVHYNANRDKRLAQRKAYRETNRDKVKAYRDVNHDKILTQRKVYREANRDKAKAYRDANRDKMLERYKTYYAEYRAKHGVSPITALRQRDPQARLANILRTRLKHALKGKFKTGSAVRDLGMPVDAFLVYLNLDALDKYGIPYTGNESQFHIDHIKPLVSFDLQEPEQLRIAVRWDNLQVLTVKENLEKSAKLISD